VLGRLRRATAEAERAATSSLAAVSDNPVYVTPCEGYPLGATLSNGSYHNAQAPPAMDGLAMAWADICQLLERQTERLLTDPTVFGEGHVPVKILYMVQTWWAEEARTAAQPTLIPLGGYGQNDTCAPSFFAWRRQEQVGRCLDAAMAIVSAIASQALSDAGREPPPALTELLTEVRSRFPVVTESHPLGEEAGRLAAWFTERALA
jgi:histidine ammonia-lyase